MEQQKEGIRQEFMLLNWYLKEHLASAVRIAAFIGVFSLLCFLRNVPQDVTVYMIVLMAAVGAAGFLLSLWEVPETSSGLSTPCRRTAGQNRSASGGGRASGAGLPADHRILRAAVSGRTD